MATQKGLARVAAINANIAQTGGIAPSASSLGGSSTPTPSHNYVSTNPHDAPGYHPEADPTSSAYNPNAPTQPLALPTQPTTPTTVDTAPNNAQINPPNLGIVDTLNQAGKPSDFASRSTLAGQYGIQNYTGTAQQNTDLASQYRAGLSKVQGLAVSDTQGKANEVIQQNLPQDGYDGTTTNQYLEQEPVFTDILDQFAEMMSSENQAKSLTEQYDSLVKTSGLQSLNTKLIDMAAVIRGTESDIRLEVEKSQGFATNSQILAMSSARNKVLLENYTNLLATRDNIQQQIDTSISLSKQDRDYASQRMSQQLDLGFRLLDYKEKFIRNSNENYNNIIKSVGYQGLLQSTGGDSHYIGLIEKSLGLFSGGLTQLANLPPPPLTEMEQADLAYKKAQTSNIYSDIKARETTTTTQKPPTQAQLQVAGYRDRMVEANNIINQIGSKFTGTASYLGGWLPNALKSGERQQFEQAQRNFINAVLRRESGAAIAPSEFDSAAQQYFPQPGDTPQVLQQKAATRNNVISSYQRESSSVASPNVVVGPDGKEYEVTN